MRLLLDTCVSSQARVTVAALGHDVDHTSDWPSDPGDEAILAFAFSKERILITLDKDFGELAVALGRPHAGILRRVDVRAVDQGPSCVAALAKYGAELARGAIITVEPTRVRVRPPG